MRGQSLVPFGGFFDFQRLELPVTEGAYSSERSLHGVIGCMDVCIEVCEETGAATGVPSPSKEAVMRGCVRIQIQTLVFVLASVIAASADPIGYSISGRISHLGGPEEEFLGSFVLSDPATEVFGLNDTRGDQRDLFTLSSFSLSSASHSLDGTGAFAIWWGLFRGSSNGLNFIDSGLFFDTSGGFLESREFSPIRMGGRSSCPARAHLRSRNCAVFAGTWLSPFRLYCRAGCRHSRTFDPFTVRIRALCVGSAWEATSQNRLRDDAHDSGSWRVRAPGCTISLSLRLCARIRTRAGHDP